MLEDNGVIGAERGASTKATSAGLEIGPGRTLSSHMRAVDVVCHFSGNNRP